MNVSIGIAVFFVFIILYGVFAGIRYCKIKQNTGNILEIKKRRLEFGVSNSGTSMDDNGVYKVPYEKFGIN